MEARLNELKTNREPGRKSTLFNFKHLSKQLFSIRETDDGIAILPIDITENAFSSIISNCESLSNSTLIKSIQYSNAQL